METETEKETGGKERILGEQKEKEKVKQRQESLIGSKQHDLREVWRRQKEKKIQQDQERKERETEDKERRLRMARRKKREVLEKFHKMDWHEEEEKERGEGKVQETSRLHRNLIGEKENHSNCKVQWFKSPQTRDLPRHLMMSKASQMTSG